jgi:two-component system CheB/CheR fusion protein
MDQSRYFVAVGASAGGLEALELFFRNMPEDSGMTFIVIQHLSPDYKSMMDELLARYTNMKILVAEDGMMTEANKIYLIPPSQNLSIYHEKLFLEQHVRHSHLNLPIDVFFKSLAADQGTKAIGVVLSGTGSDGTNGARSIKEVGGMIMVQSLESAKFDGMPKSCISTGLADFILSPEEMGQSLSDFVLSPSLKQSEIQVESEAGLDDLSKIAMILRKHANIDFSSYKENTVLRRLDRRIKINRCVDIKNYIQLLSESDSEKEILFKKMLIGVTRFFRDEEAYESLKKIVFPNLDTEKESIRIWSAGCSTGEEVYSLAILLNEYLEKEKIKCKIKIFATDIDSRALEIAGNGYYLESVLLDIPPDLVAKYFIKKREGYQINEQIRKMIVFAKHNILKDPPFSKLDLLVCRNLFIYIKGPEQQNILSSFYYSLYPNGYLWLGSSESLGDLQEAFTVLDSKWKIYRYKLGYRPLIVKHVLHKLDYSNMTDIHEKEQRISSRSLRIEKVLASALMATLPPSIIIDSQDNIIQVIGNIGHFITTQPGRFSKNFNSNMSKEMALFVKNCIRKLKTKREDVFLNNIYIDSNKKSIGIKGHLLGYNIEDLFLISFIVNNGVEEEDSLESVNKSEEIKNRVLQSESELQLASEGFQTTIEELETSNEELQSSNEELIASNEELQSTTEELQSVNEELYTVNSEYQIKIDELTHMTNDLENLLRNTEVGALYLDRKSCIRKITPVMTKVTNILQSDMGRPIDHLKVMENYSQLLEDIDQVKETLQSVERKITLEDATIWLIRIRPYRTEYNAIDGIIVTVVEITSLEETETKKQLIKAKLLQALEAGKVAWWEYDVVTGLVNYSDNKATMLGYSAKEFPNDVYEICDLIHPEDYDMTMKAMKDYLTGVSEEWDMVYRMKKKSGDYAYFHDRGEIISYDNNKPKLLMGTVVDISNLYKNKTQS